MNKRTQVKNIINTQWDVRVLSALSKLSENGFGPDGKIKHDEIVEILKDFFETSGMNTSVRTAAGLGVGKTKSYQFCTIPRKWHSGFFHFQADFQDDRIYVWARMVPYDVNPAPSSSERYDGKDGAVEFFQDTFDLMKRMLNQSLDQLIPPNEKMEDAIVALAVASNCLLINDMDAFHRQMKNAIKKIGIPLQDVANRSVVSRDTVVRICRCGENPQLNNIARVMSFLQKTAMETYLADR